METYFWVKGIEAECGEVFFSFEEALAEAQTEAELEAVYPLGGGLIEVIRVTDPGDNQTVVWRSKPLAERPAPSQASR